MPISTTELLTYGRELLKESNTEVEARNISGRFYYAAFNETNRINGFIPDYLKDQADIGGVHAKRIARFSDVMVAQDIGLTSEVRRKFKGVGFALQFMKGVRVTADYHLASEFKIENSALMLKHAQKIFDYCAEINELMSESENINIG